VSKGVLFGIAVTAVLGLVVVILLVPWSVSPPSCPPHQICESTNGSLNLFKVAAIVALGLVAVVALLFGLNTDRS